MSNISYILGANRINLTKALDRVADQMANTQTAAFKTEREIFSELVLTTEDQEKLSFSDSSNTIKDFSQGGFLATHRSLDVALDGEGFFMMETPLGNRYTRAGNFTITDGLLTTVDGHTILGPGGGFVEFVEGDTDIKILEDGIVLANGEERGQIGVFDFPDKDQLQKIGKNNYKSDIIPRPLEEAIIVQGMLEKSNVNALEQMTNLSSITREIESNAKIQKQQYELLLNTIRKLTSKS